MNWEALLQMKHEFEVAVKARAMIYQVDSKESAALAFGKPLNHYYHWPYVEWVKVDRRYVRKFERVQKECIQLGIPVDMPWSSFPHFRKRMGLDRKL